MAYASQSLVESSFVVPPQKIQNGKDVCFEKSALATKKAYRSLSQS